MADKPSEAVKTARTRTPATPSPAKETATATRAKTPERVPETKPEPTAREKFKEGIRACRPDLSEKELDYLVSTFLK